MYAPWLLRFELANTAWKKIERDPADIAGEIIAALAIALDDRSGLIWRDVDPADTVLLAQATGMTAYDASYLWLAASLGADLVTLDDRLAKALDDLHDERLRNSSFRSTEPSHEIRSRIHS